MIQQDTLSKLLDKERQALLDMNEALLKEALAEKESLSVLDLAYNASLHEMDALKQKTERNQKLMSAALSGLRQAASVLAQHRTGKDKISVYNHIGERKTISAANRSTLEKKA